MAEQHLLAGMEQIVPKKEHPAYPKADRKMVKDIIIAEWFSAGVPRSQASGLDALASDFLDLGLHTMADPVGEIRKRRAAMVNEWDVGSDTVWSIIKHWSLFASRKAVATVHVNGPGAREQARLDAEWEKIRPQREAEERERLRKIRER